MQMNRILSCHFDLKYCATWRCKASCVYMISRVFERVDNVVKLYCECVNNNDGLCFMIFFVDFFNTACIVEIKHYCTERVVLGGFLSRDIQPGWVFINQIIMSCVCGAREHDGELQTVKSDA